MTAATQLQKSKTESVIRKSSTERGALEKIVLYKSNYDCKEHENNNLCGMENRECVERSGTTWRSVSTFYHRRITRSGPDFTSSAQAEST